MKKIIIAFILFVAAWFIYYQMNQTTHIVIEYTEDSSEVKCADLWTDINPNVDQTTVKVYNNGYEELIEIDTRYEKLIHPSSWKYIHTDGKNIRIVDAYAVYNDSVYKLKINK